MTRKMAEGNCTHYWDINSNNVGLCRYCGAVRDFGKELKKWLSKDLEGRLERGARRGRPRKSG